MTDGVKTYLDELFTKAIYIVEKDIASKYFDKGIACEQDALDLLQKCLFKGEFVGKNKKHFKNEMLCGTPDALKKDFVFDTKNAFDVFTFDKVQLSWDYEWQVRGYMNLTEKKRGFIFYCLIDMPDFLMADEERKLFYSGKFLTTESQDYKDACIELQRKYKYDYLTDAERFKLFEVEYTKEHKDIITQSVSYARKYLNNKLEERTELLINNINLINKGIL